jgi:hypothetical protein
MAMMDKLIRKLQYREQTHQICFCTPESLFALETVKDENRHYRQGMFSISKITGILHAGGVPD